MNRTRVGLAVLLAVLVVVAISVGLGLHFGRQEPPAETRPLSTIANDWLHLHRHYGEFLVASLRVPHVALSAAEWQRLAIQAAKSHTGCNCSWAARGKYRAA